MVMTKPNLVFLYLVYNRKVIMQNSVDTFYKIYFVLVIITKMPIFFLFLTSLLVYFAMYYSSLYLQFFHRMLSLKFVTLIILILLRMI